MSQKSMHDSHPESPYGVICRNCGPQGLTKENYDMQMRAANSLWVCPECGQTASWDDDLYDAAFSEPDEDDEEGTFPFGEFDDT